MEKVITEIAKVTIEFGKVIIETAISYKLFAFF